jgi:hypothetical protein
VAFEEAPHLSVMEGNGDYPSVPRMRVLTAEEAREIIPGWGDDERYDGDIKVFQGTTVGFFLLAVRYESVLKRSVGLGRYTSQTIRQY